MEKNVWLLAASGLMDQMGYSIWDMMRLVCGGPVTIAEERGLI